MSLGAAATSALARQPARLVAPPLDGPPTGGTLFDARLLEALAALGEPVERISLEEGLARGPAPSGDLWVDSLYLGAVPALARRAGGRVGLWLHYLPSLVDRGAAWSPSDLDAVERAALGTARTVVVPSAWMEERVTGTVARGRVFVVEPGTEPLVPPAPPERAAGELRVVMAANVVPGKGVLPCLEALANALERGPAPLTLTIVGSVDAAPGYAAACRSVAARPSLLGLVHFAGEAAPRETQAAIARADVFASASRMESYGMALAEARALGVPIVALPGGNVAAHVDEAAGGVLVGDDRDLAREIVGLAARPSEVAARRGRAARARRARSWTAAARDFVQGPARWP